MHTSSDVELLRPKPFNWYAYVAAWVAALAWLYFVIFVKKENVQELAEYLYESLFGVSWIWFFHYLFLVNRDVILSVEGIRKGRGGKSIFIPWLGATVYYGHRSWIVCSNGKKITLGHHNFDERRFQEIMLHIRNTIIDQALIREQYVYHDHTPLHVLSEIDKRNFINIWEDLSNLIFLRYISIAIIIITIPYFYFFIRPIAGWELIPLIRHAIRQFKSLSPLLSDQRFVACAATANFMMVVAFIFSFYDRFWLKRSRKDWLTFFQNAQIISISELGISHETHEETIFTPWHEISKIIQRKQLLLFYLQGEYNMPIIVPKRVFPTLRDANAFYMRAIEFKTVSARRPNVLEPISFWEIA